MGKIQGSVGGLSNTFQRMNRKLSSETRATEGRALVRHTDTTRNQPRTHFWRVSKIATSYY
jgi:hypothetical protein